MKLNQIFPGAKRTLAYCPELAHLMGNDIDGALLLCQFIYWHGKAAERNNGWTRKSQAEILQETGLTRSRQESARRKLKDLGFIKETNVGKSPPVIGFRVELHNISAAWDRFKANPDAVKAQIKQAKARESKRALPHNVPAKSAEHFGRDGPDDRSQRNVSKCSHVSEQSALSPQNLYTEDDDRDNNRDETLHLSSPSPSGKLDDNKDIALLSSSTSDLSDDAETFRSDVKQDAVIDNPYKAQTELDDKDLDDEEPGSDGYHSIDYDDWDDSDPFAEE